MKLKASSHSSILSGRKQLSEGVFFFFFFFFFSLPFPSDNADLTMLSGDQTGSNGANLTWPVDFGVPDSPPQEGPKREAAFYDKNSWIVGVVNAGPYIGSAFL